VPPAEFAALVRRVDRLERRVNELGRVPALAGVPDQARWWVRRDATDLPESLSQGPNWAPWVSKSVQISERLTSFEFAVKATAGQAALFGLGGGLFGAGAAWLLRLPWYASPVLGVASGTLALTLLLIDHRGMLHQVVREAGARKPRYGELRVQIEHSDGRGTDYLFLKEDVAREDLRELAQGVLAGKSLAVHAWVGVGGWTRTKFDNVMAELEKMGYTRPGRGNKARELTAKGRALFRALAE